MNDKSITHDNASKQECVDSLQDHRPLPAEPVPEVDHRRPGRGLLRRPLRHGGHREGVSLRTVQGDLQIMRSDKLGYNAPIEVYDKIYYRYADPDYSISDTPLTDDDCTLLLHAIKLLSGETVNLDDVKEILAQVRERLTVLLIHE